MSPSKKIKVLWLCTFSNEEKRSHLNLWRSYPAEVGQWIPNLLSGIEGRDDGYEFHVVSTEPYLKGSLQSWEAKGIHYHCFQTGIPGLGKPWPIRLPVDHILGFPLNRQRTRSIIRKVQPDIVHLFGAENPQYACGVLDLPEDVPVVVTIQGIVARQLHFNPNLHTQIRCRFEDRLLRSCRNFMGELDSREYIKTLNEDISYEPFYFPVNEELLSEIPKGDKRFDVLFAGSMTKAKGFGDFLEVVRLLKTEIPGVQAGVVGNKSGWPGVEDFLQQHQLEKNIHFLGRVPTQKELFGIYQEAKVFLSPTYNDCFPSTVRECMLLGIPVVAYATGGMPYVNTENEQRILLVGQGAIPKMTENVLHLLGNPSFYTDHVNRALSYAQVEFSRTKNISSIFNQYNRLLGRL